MLKPRTGVLNGVLFFKKTSHTPGIKIQTDFEILMILHTWSNQSEFHIRLKPEKFLVYNFSFCEPAEKKEKNA